jgi:hypothetical protein
MQGGATRAQILLITAPPEGCSCNRQLAKLDGADGLTFEEFGVGSDTEGSQQAGLHLS